LLDWVNGGTVQCWQDGDVPEYWADIDDPNWMDDCKFRIKPEPKRETVKLSMSGSSIGFDQLYQHVSIPTHRITFDMIDGKPDCGSIRMERI